MIYFYAQSTSLTMKSLFIITTLSLLLTGCSYYQYYPAPVNAPSFANKLEAQVTATAGLHGISTGSSMCLTKRMLFAGQYNTLRLGGLFLQEGETSTGFNLLKTGNKYLNVYAGYGFGNSYMKFPGKEVKEFDGRFHKPFTAISFSSATTTYKKVKADALIALKTDYIFYKSDKLRYHNETPVLKTFEDRNFFYELYFGGNVGGKYVRFNFGTGFAFKRLKETGEGVRVFPVHLTFGLTGLIYRKYDQKEEAQ